MYIQEQCDYSSKAGSPQCGPPIDGDVVVEDKHTVPIECYLTTATCTKEIDIVASLPHYSQLHSDMNVFTVVTKYSGV